MKEKKILSEQSPNQSKFQLVLAAAKRSKQINYMAKERGLPANQVASIKTKYIKPPTIALMEILEGKIVNFSKDIKENSQASDAIPEEEASPEASEEPSPETPEEPSPEAASEEPSPEASEKHSSKTSAAT
ncbi:MAG: DNA-directed RNA polymerase subunit omega [bacterium]